MLAVNGVAFPQKPGVDEFCAWQLAAGQFEFSRHAFHRAVERNISEQGIREAVVLAEVIENYPGDKYSPSALLLGFTVAGRPLHSQVAFDDSQLSKIITIYQPDPNAWIEFRKRGGHVQMSCVRQYICESRVRERGFHVGG